MKIDVVIIGAGVSGVPAAVAAARTGAATLLLEQASKPGGTMRVGLGFPLCGLFRCEPSGVPKLLNEGLCAELFKLISREVADPVAAMGQTYVCHCPVPLFESIYTRWIDAENLISFFEIQNLSVTTEHDRIETIRFEKTDGTKHEYFPRQVIDCTGTGVLIELSGAEQIIPKKLPLAGFSVQLQGVQADGLLPIKVPYVLRKAVEDGILPPSCAFTVFSQEESSLCKFSLPAEASIKEAQQIAQHAVELLIERIEEFHSAEAVAFSPAVIPREGVRLKGEYILTADDVKTGRRFKGAVAHGGWPIEYWDAQTGVQYDYVGGNGSYDIPQRALRSVNIKNLWAAGRALSADSRALASARVMGTAIATGEAAGRAVAKEVK